MPRPAARAAISMRQWCAGQGNRTAADLFDRLRAALDRPACVRTASRAWAESPDRLGERLDQAVRALDGFADGLSPRRQCRVIETGLSAAVRKAVAGITEDGHLTTKPQVIRIERAA